MPLAHRRLYGWDGDKWIKILVDDDGNIVGNLPKGIAGGETYLRVSDTTNNELLGEMVDQLKIMNTHLQIITGEEIKNAD